MKKIIAYIVILMVNLKDFFMSLSSKETGKVNVGRFSPALKKLGLKWLHKIKKYTFQAETSFVGSVALSLPGSKDLDYVICCNQKDIFKNIDMLNKILGKPLSKSNKSAKWKLIDGSVNIDVILVLKSNRMNEMLMDTFHTIKNSTDLTAEYKRIKIGLNGKSKKEYELKRLYFFNKVFYKYGHGLDFLYKHDK